MGTDVTAERKEGVESADSKTLRVWLVDDSENFRVLLAALLEDEGGIRCERQCSTAEEALEALRMEEAPDAVLLDVRMPGMGGIAAVAPIRQLAVNSRILMLTTFGDMEARRKAMQDGASDFLLKSFQVQEIAQRVKVACAAPLPAVRPAVEVSAVASSNCSVDTRAEVKSRMTRETTCVAKSKTDCGTGFLSRSVRALRIWVNHLGRSRKSAAQPLPALASSR